MAGDSEAQPLSESRAPIPGGIVGMGFDMTIQGNTSTAPEPELPPLGAQLLGPTETTVEPPLEDIPPLTVEEILPDPPTEAETTRYTVTIEDVTNRPESPNEGDTTLVRHPASGTLV